MACSFLKHPVTLALALLVTTGNAASDTLTLGDALERAVQHDVKVARLAADSDALQQQAIANSQLPDPKLKLGAMNFPTDSFSRNQEPMTQLQVGVVQMFPPGDTLELKGKRTQSMARSRDAMRSAQQLKLERDTRRAYLELYYQQQAAAIVARTYDTFAEQLEVIRSHYASGQLHQQDVLRATVELALLEDKQAQINTDIDQASATLGELIGPLPQLVNLSDPFNAIPRPPLLSELQDNLMAHPELRAETALLTAEQLAVDVARQQYKPAWSLDVTYGDRSGTNPNGSERSDFLSAMVMLDIPLFRDKRQDRQLAASQQTAEAARLQREAKLLALTRQLHSSWAEWERTAERLQQFDSLILPQAQASAESALSAYQNRVTDFNNLISARLTALDSELKALRLKVNHARAQTELLYLAGDHHE